VAIVPHTYQYFNAFSLLLRPETIGNPAVDSRWEMGWVEACEHLAAFYEFHADKSTANFKAFPTPPVIQVLGGDPFLSIDDLVHVLDTVERNRFLVEVSTTGLWVESASQVSETFDRLDGKVHAIFVDTSRQLLDRIGLHRMELLLVEARKRRLGVKIRCGVAADTPFPNDLMALDVMNADTSITQVVPMPHSHGTGGQWILEAPPLRRRCAEFFAFFVAAGGDVYPCSHGAGLSALRLGSLSKESILAIVERAIALTGLKELRDNGPHSLYQAIRHSGHGDRLLPGFVDACHFHRHVLSDPALNQIIHNNANKDLSKGEPINPLSRA